MSKKRSQNELRVIVEIRIKKNLKSDSASDVARGIRTTSFKVDENYGPLPMSFSREKNFITSDEKGVIIRGYIKENKIAELESEPNVIHVSKDSKLGFYSCPIPPCDCQSSVPKGDLAQVAAYLGVHQIWEEGFGGQGIVIGIVDSGINAVGRTQMAGETVQINNVIGGYPLSNWGTTSKWNGHGNMTSTDTLGMAPYAQLYDIRISDSDSDDFFDLTLSKALAGYQWAIDQHQNNGKPDILTNSWGPYQENGEDYSTNPNNILTQKVVEAINEGILVLFAAGNCGVVCYDVSKCGSDIGPGKSIWGANGHHLVMTVGAANINGEFVGYSSQGPAALDPIKPDFCSITHFTGYFPSDSGTSAATPIAAGVVALLKQAGSYLTQDQIKHALMETATDIGPAGWDPHSGAGIINAIEAWNYLFPGGSPNKGVSDQQGPIKFKAVDDPGKQPASDPIRFPGEIVTNPPIRWLSRSSNVNAPFVLATPHHSKWIRRNSTSYFESYEEALSEYKLAIAKLQEQLMYLQNEYSEMQEEYNKRLRRLRR